MGKETPWACEETARRETQKQPIHEYLGWYVGEAAGERPTIGRAGGEHADVGACRVKLGVVWSFMSFAGVYWRPSFSGGCLCNSKAPSGTLLRRLCLHSILLPPLFGLGTKRHTQHNVFLLILPFFVRLAGPLKR